MKSHDNWKSLFRIFIFWLLLLPLLIELDIQWSWCGWLFLTCLKLKHGSMQPYSTYGILFSWFNLVVLDAMVLNYSLPQVSHLKLGTFFLSSTLLLLFYPTFFLFFCYSIWLWWTCWIFEIHMFDFAPMIVFNV